MTEKRDDRQHLPAGRAFVVQLSSAATPLGLLCGRVEHVVSGQASWFGSAAELQDFLGQVLAAAERPDATEAPAHRGGPNPLPSRQLRARRPHGGVK